MKKYLYLLAGSATLLALLATGHFYPAQPNLGPAFPFSPLHLIGAALSFYWLTVGGIRLLVEAPTIGLLDRGSEATTEKVIVDTTCNNDCSIVM